MIIRFFADLPYQFLKLLVLCYQRIYFPVTKVTNEQDLDFLGPAIIVSNHPNTLLDPMNVISRTSRRAFFLANASMFKHPLASSFLHNFCIPIRRPGRDDDAKKTSNHQSFILSYDHLSKGGVIYIAPEGSSDMERHLRPIKTGAARISLGAESENDFKLGLRIIPVGLNYEHPSQCGSRLLIKVGKPIFAANWETDYRENPKKAVQEMTATLESQMQSLIIHTDDDEQDQLLFRLEGMLQNDQPMALIEHYNRTQKLLKGLQNLKKENNTAYQQLCRDAQDYGQQLKNNGIRDRGISQQHKKLFTPFAIIGWPLWLYGRINNWLAIEIPRWLVVKLDLYVGYTSTVKILSGLLTFPVFYYLQYKLVDHFMGQPIAGYYLLSLPVSAILQQVYQRYTSPRLAGWKWRRWQQKEPAAAKLIVAAREKLRVYIKSMLGSL